MFPHFVFVVVILMGTAAAAGSGAQTAAAMDAKKVQELLPAGEIAKADEIRQGFDNQRITPFGDPRFYFEILVPKDWDSRPVTVTRQQLAEDASSLVPMAELTPNDEKKTAKIQVVYSRVPERVSLEKFVTVYAEQSGYSVVARQRGEFNGRQVEDALLKGQTGESNSAVTRFTASRRGELIFIVASSCIEKEYQQYKKIFGVAAVSFNPSATKSEAQPVAQKVAAGPRFARIVVTDNKEDQAGKTVFPPETKDVYVRFWLADAPAPTPVKIIWIGEKVEGVQANSELTSDELSMGGPRDNGNFSLEPPTSRWPPGIYRAELYLGGKLAHTARFRVEAR